MGVTREMLAGLLSGLLLVCLIYWLLGRLCRWYAGVRLSLRASQGLTPTSTVFVPQSPVVDIDHSPLFTADAGVLGQGGRVYLALDTETVDALDDEEGIGSLSPAVALSWALLDERGHCLRECSYVLQRAATLSVEAIALHGITQVEMESGSPPERVYRMLLDDAERANWAVAHNLRFHLGVITQDLEALGLEATSLCRLSPLCTMELGRQLGFKGSRIQGEASYPSLGELFAYLYFGRLDVAYTYRSKSLRDIRLLGASLRRLIARRLV